MSRNTKIIFAIIAAIIVGVLAYFGFNSIFSRSTKLSWSDFTKKCGYVREVPTQETATDDSGKNTTTDEDGTVVVYYYTTENVEIVKVVVDNYNYYGYTAKKDSSGKVVTDTTTGKPVAESSYAYSTTGPSAYSSSTTGEAQRLLDACALNKIDVNYSDPNSGSIFSSLISVGGIVIMLIVVFMLFSQMSGGGKGGVMSFGKTKAKITTNIKKRFSDVAGAEEEKAELQEITEFLKNPGKFSSLGARIPKGVLLVGPPGTGKTLFAKAVAGEAGVPFFSVSGSDFVEMYVGVGASRVRDLFDIAKHNQPCIIFIDEIDAVGRERGAGLGGGSDEREQTLNQILVQMDGFEDSESVIVMAATNRADVLDSALMRPGRFDRKIMVNLPDVKGREAILKVHSRNKPLAPNVNFKTLARITSGFSGADLENLLNEAAILTARQGKKLIGNVELYEGVNKVIMGPQKKSYVVTESDKRCTAYHESGHAIIAQVCKNCDPVQEVSIIPRGNAAGYTMTRPDSDDKDVSKNKLRDILAMTLGGRVAEELVIKDVTTGASSDLQKVSDIARRMVVEWGMSDKVGLISYGEAKPVFIGREISASKEYSDATAALIDSEVHALINEAHDRAVAILTENRAILDNMARLLVERETIYNEEVCMLMEGHTVEDVLRFMDENGESEKENPFARYEHNFQESGKTEQPKAEENKIEDTVTENGNDGNNGNSEQ